MSPYAICFAAPAGTSASAKEVNLVWTGSVTDTKLDPQQVYRHRFDARAKTAKAKVWQVLVGSFFQKWIRSDDTVLELGCGYGEFLNYLRCKRRIGVDLNPDSAEHLEERIEFHEGNILDLAFVADESVDVVFTSNVMEHLPSKSDIETMLGEVRRVLKSGAHFIALGPNIRFLPRRYWDFWDHLVPISDRSLRELLTNMGFEIIDCYPKFLPYTTCGSFPKAGWLVWLYIKIRVAWWILGRQFLLRVRKP